nr:serine racemase [Quercus suber]
MRLSCLFGETMEAENEIRREKYVADISSIREAEGDSYFLNVNVSKRGEILNNCECGAFKFRGACNAVFSLDNDEAAKGVVTHSSGNHAAALSLAAKLRGIPAYIVIPNGAPKCKVENVMRYGGQVIWSEATMQSRESVASKVLQETGAVLVHPYNDGRIISGQGTISLEFLEQAPQIDTLIVPISGGGLISGVALAAKSINPTIRILAAEPRGADDAARSKAAGRIITLPETNTVADGLRAFLGNFTWPIVRDLVEDIVTVEDNEIIEAMKLCYEILKVVVEPSGAIGLAAVLSDSFKNNPALKNCSNIGIILSGAHAARFDITNNCPYTVWAAAVPGGGRQLNSRQSWPLDVNAGTTGARIWARTGCSFDGSGRGRCQTGDCGGWPSSMSRLWCSPKHPCRIRIEQISKPGFL